jgi:hypothetical protein
VQRLRNAQADTRDLGLALDACQERFVSQVDLLAQPSSSSKITLRCARVWSSQRSDPTLICYKPRPDPLPPVPPVEAAPAGGFA